MSRPNTTLKTILVFQDRELIRQMIYLTKKNAIGNYRLLKKHGLIDHVTGEQISNIRIELI